MLIYCWLLLQLWESVIVLCFAVRYFMSILVLQPCLVCLPGVSWLLYGSSSQCHGFVCSLWLCFFLIILTYYSCNFALQSFQIPAHNGPSSRPLYSRFPPPLPPIPHPLPPIPHLLSPYPRPPVHPLFIRSCCDTYIFYAMHWVLYGDIKSFEN